MENEEKEFSPEQSLKLISSMIETTKNSLSDSSHYYLLWGWAVLLACLGQYYLKVILHYPEHYLVWWITPLVLIIQIIFIVQDRKKEKVRTFISEANSYLWTAIGLAYFAIAFIFSRIGWQYSYPFYIIMYGIGTYVSGSLLKFKPLIIGGIICFPLTIIASYLDYSSQILIMSLAILVSYLIPGYMLRARFKKVQSNVKRS